METVVLDVKTRANDVKAKDLLRNNLIPAIYYGRGVENQSLQMDYQTFRKLFRHAGTNTIIELNVDGKSKHNVLVHDINYDPVTDAITHVDFINVRMDEEIVTKLPINLVGVAPAVKELGGTLVHQLAEIEIKCLPKDLIHSVEVGVDMLVDFHTFIRVKDVVLPPTVKVLSDSEEVIAMVMATKVEEETSVVAASTEGAAPAEGAPASEGAAEEKKEN